VNTKLKGGRNPNYKNLKLAKIWISLVTKIPNMSGKLVFGQFDTIRASKEAQPPLFDKSNVKNLQNGGHAVSFFWKLIAPSLILSKNHFPDIFVILVTSGIQIICQFNLFVSRTSLRFQILICGTEIIKYFTSCLLMWLFGQIATNLSLIHSTSALTIKYF